MLGSLAKNLWLEAKKGNHAYFVTFERLLNQSFDESINQLSCHHDQEIIAEKEKEVAATATVISYTELTVKENERKTKEKNDLLIQMQNSFHEYFVRKLDEQNNSVLYYTCLCGHTELFNYLLTKVGGIDRIDKNERLRCRTNALNYNIRQLLDGKPWKEVQMELQMAIVEDLKNEEEESGVLISSMFGGDGY